MPRKNTIDTKGFHKKSFSSGDTKLNSFLKEKVPVTAGGDDSSPVTENIYTNPLLVEVELKVINEIDATFVSSLKDKNMLKSHIQQVVDHVCNREFPTLANSSRHLIVQSLMDEFTGFGPLQNLISDNSVSEIMVNGPNQVYVEKNGLLTLTNVKFRNNEHVIQVIDKIVSPLGRRVDESSPMVDARLPDGSRVNAIINPISLTGPTITIRKFSSVPLTVSMLISYGSISTEIAKFIQMAVLAKANIIVAGGTGSGKTTFLNVLSSFIPDGERIITIEDAAELRLCQSHVISLEARPPNIEGKGEITIRDLVRNSLRMRPDRIVIGEVRGSESLDMLQAMNTGHNGSLSTVHANSSRDALSRLETMVLYTGIDFPMKAIREQLHSALDLIIYVERLPDGSRKVTKITEVLGMEGDTIVLQDIFTFVRKGMSHGKIYGDFESPAIRPKIYDKFDTFGIS